MGIETAIIAAAVAGATAISANQERKAAKSAANAQRDIAQKEIDAVKESEQLAQQTAQTKLRAAQARKSQTILTSPELEEVNVNQKSALGV